MDDRDLDADVADDGDSIPELRFWAKEPSVVPGIVRTLLAQAADEIARLRQIPVQVASICVEYTELVPSDMPFPAALEVVLARYQRALELLRQVNDPIEGMPYREIRELLIEANRM